MILSSPKLKLNFVDHPDGSNAATLVGECVLIKDGYICALGHTEQHMFEALNILYETEGQEHGDAITEG